GARGSDAIREQTRRDRHPRLVFLVSAAIGVEGDDGGDALGGGALEGVDHDEEFEDRGADRRAKRLNDENILTTHVLLDLDEDILVGELVHLRLAHWKPQMAADILRQLWMRTAREHDEIIHGPPPCAPTRGLLHYPPGRS